jgi:cellulose synthase operon protein C
VLAGFSIGAGDFVKKLTLTASAAMLVLVTFAGSAATQAQTSQSQSETNYCQLVKSPSAKATCLIARTQFYNGNYRVSLATMRKALDASPKEGIIRAMTARILMRFDDTGAAERELRQARKDGAPDHAVLPVLFRAMVARHEEINLLNEFPEPAANAKGDVAADILQGRAMALLSQERVADAAAAMDRSLSLSRDADGLLVRAKIATQQNNLPLAKKMVADAYRLDSKNGSVLFAQLQQSELSNDAAGTLAVSDQMLKLYPHNSDARESRIRVFFKQNQDAKARAEVGAILARSPGAGVGLYYKAMLLVRAKDDRGAWQVMQQVPPEFVKAHPSFAVSMAELAFKNGSVETGATILGNALSTTPGQLDARLRLASLRLSQNRPQSAMLLMTPVKDSHDPQAQKLLAEVRGRIAKDRAF